MLVKAVADEEGVKTGGFAVSTMRNALEFGIAVNKGRNYQI